MAKTISAKTWGLAAGADFFRRSKPPLDDIAPTIPTGLGLTVLNSSAIRVDWTASTDSQSSVAYYIVERSPNGTTGWTSIGTPAAVTFTDSSCAPATTYYYRVKAVDGSPQANISAASSVVNATTTAGAALQWDVLTPSYLPVIPGLAGWGMNTPAGSGRHLPTPSTNVFIVDTLSNDRTTGSQVQTNPSIYRCSLAYACQSTLPGVVVFEVSGVMDLQRTQNVYGRYKTLAFQTAPSPGFHIKNGSLAAKGGDQLIWHMSNYNGDQASLQDSGARRNLSMGITGTSNYVAAWCSGFWSSDQAMDTSVGGSNFTIVHCLLAEALCDSIHPKGVHGYAVLFEHTTDYVSFYRNIIAHFIERDPLSRSPHAFVGNCLMYNAKGQTVVPIGGYGCNPANYGGVTTQTNLESNLFIKGPNFSSAYGGSKPIFLLGQPSAYGFIAGSKLYIGNNRAFDFGTITTQNDLWNSGGTLPANLVVTSRLDASYPEGMALKDPGALGFAQLMADTCGARPGDRAAGRDALVCSHFLNKLAGSGDYGTGLNTPPSGPLTATANTRLLLNSGAMGGDPLPNGTDRDTVQASGYTKLEEWLYRQHLAVM